MVCRFNFHGQWYTDSDALNDILRFRVMTYQQYIAGAWQAMETMIANGDAAALAYKGADEGHARADCPSGDGNAVDAGRGTR